MRTCVAVLTLLACNRQESARKAEPGEGAAQGLSENGAAQGSSAAAGQDASVDASRCPQQPFAQSTPLAEASGAAWLTVDGKLSLVVVADSGHTGDYVLIDPDSGATREQGKLPLGKHGDDIEGLASIGDKLFGLTSDGWMRVWQRTGSGFELVDGPYAIGGDTKRNYEGLALAAAPAPGSCAGFACSKGDGHVYCLVASKGRYSVDPGRRISVTRPGTLADCTISDTGTLWVGNNVFGLDQVFRIDGWADPARANVVPANALGVGFSEVIAVRGDMIYRMSDTGGSPSLMAKFRCAAIAR